GRAGAGSSPGEGQSTRRAIARESWKLPGLPGGAPVFPPCRVHTRWSGGIPPLCQPKGRIPEGFFAWSKENRPKLPDQLQGWAAAEPETRTACPPAARSSSEIR